MRDAKIRQFLRRLKTRERLKRMLGVCMYACGYQRGKLTEQGLSIHRRKENWEFRFPTRFSTRYKREMSREKWFYAEDARHRGTR